LIAETAWTLDQLARKERAEAGYAVVANMHKGHDEALRAWAEAHSRLVYIGRGIPRLGLEHSLFANKKFPTPEQAVEYYARHLQESPYLLALLPALRGMVLGCWCYPGPCHGQVIADAINSAMRDRIAAAA